MAGVARGRFRWTQLKRQVIPIRSKGYLSRRGLIGINLALVLMALFFGLRARGFSSANQVAWHPDRAGLHFGRYGMAYCRQAFDLASDPASSAGTELSLELAVRSAALKHDRFQILLMLHGGRDEDQLVIGQWRSSVVVMHGNDYSGRRGRRRLGAAEALPAGVERLITVVSNERGTRIFIDGRPAAHTSSLTLQIPNRRGPATLVVGNSVYARHYWNGDLYGLAIYTHALTPAAVRTQFERWKKARDFSMAVPANPEMLYLFDDRPGHKALNRMGDSRYLVIPADVQILKKEVLGLPWDNVRWGRPFWIDVAVNLLGFIPLGFFLSALREDFCGSFSKRNFLACIGLCFMLSLGIELAQAWIPSRSSQMLDLALNTMGGAIGVALQHLFGRRRANQRCPLSI